jgi:hypothetical protein
MQTTISEYPEKLIIPHCGVGHRATAGWCDHKPCGTNTSIFTLRSFLGRICEFQHGQNYLLSDEQTPRTAAMLKIRSFLKFIVSLFMAGVCNLSHTGLLKVLEILQTIFKNRRQIMKIERRSTLHMPNKCDLPRLKSFRIAWLFQGHAQTRKEKNKEDKISRNFPKMEI